MVYIIKLCNNVTIQNISFFFYSVIYNQVLLASPFVILLLTGVSTNLESKTVTVGPYTALIILLTLYL